jgi:hypothetical protein
LIDEKGAYDIKVGGSPDVLMMEGQRNKVLVVDIHEEEW